MFSSVPLTHTKQEALDTIRSQLIAVRLTIALVRPPSSPKFQFCSVHKSVPRVPRHAAEVPVAHCLRVERLVLYPWRKNFV